MPPKKKDKVMEGMFEGMRDKRNEVKLIDNMLLSVDDIVIKYKNLVHKISKPFVNKGRRVGLEYEDIVSIGYEALIKTYYKYDSRYGTSFMTYAYPSMQGIIQANIDKQPAPHSLMTHSRALKQVAMHIHYDQNQDRSYEELMEIYDITEERAKNALMYLKNPRAVSLDSYGSNTDEDNASLHDSVGVTDDYSLLDYEVFIDNLSDFQRKIVYHIAYEEKSQTDIAKMYDKSQSFISRELKKMRDIYESLQYNSRSS